MYICIYKVSCIVGILAFGLDLNMRKHVSDCGRGRTQLKE